MIWSVPIFRIFELRHDKTKNMSVRPAKTQISLGIRPVWSESSLSAWRKLGPLATHWVHSKDSDQTRRMPRLIWVFAGRTATLLVLSCRGSFTVYLFQANFYTVNFELKGDDQATNFFRVNPATGEVSLSQPLFAVDSFSSVTVSMKSRWATTWQNQQNECAPSEDSDQPGHPLSLIRVFAVRMKKPWVLSYPLSAQWRFWSDWADAQADLSLRWVHGNFVGFVMSRLKLVLSYLFHPNKCIHVAQWYNLGVYFLFTHISLVFHFWDIGKQCRPRSDAAEHGV